MKCVMREHMVSWTLRREDEDSVLACRINSVLKGGVTILKEL
jgi:hypothetical protein